MSTNYGLSCTCGAVRFRACGQPKVRGFCHCSDCRELLDVPYHCVCAWEKDAIDVTDGESQIAEYRLPTKRMTRYFCRNCGETVFNSNAMDWRVVSQQLISRSLGELPPELRSQSHFFYSRRIVTIDDELPKKG